MAQDEEAVCGGAQEPSPAQENALRILEGD
jgi:hypothetical protein